MRRVLILASLLLVPAALPAQQVEPVKVIELKRNEKDKIYYETEIYPVLKKKCMTCHSGAIKDGKLDMSTYNDLIKGGKNKGASIIVPGKKENSWLYKVSGRTEKPF